MDKRVIIILIIIIALSSTLAYSQSQINWLTNYNEALDKAQREGKPIVLYFYTQTCPYCRKMEKDTWGNEEVIKYVNQYYIPVMLDAKKENELAYNVFKIPGTPPTIILYPNGTVLKPIIGYKPPEVIKPILEIAYKIIKKEIKSSTNQTTSELLSETEEEEYTPIETKPPNTSIILALVFLFAAGVISAFSPCILPLIPIILVSQLKTKERTSVILLNLGFLFSFTMLGLVAGILGESIKTYISSLSTLTYILLIVFGLILLIDKLNREFIKLASRTTNITSNKKWSGATGSFILGSLLGILWTPCIGPFTGAMITYAVISGSFILGAFSGSIYALGFITTMYTLSRIIAKASRKIAIEKAFGKAKRKKMKRKTPVYTLSKKGRIIEKIAGITMILLGLLFLTGYGDVLLLYLPSI